MSAEVSQNLFAEANRDDDSAALQIADVVFDRPLDHVYCYRVPDELESSVEAGRRVIVPFGRGNQKTTGFCVAVRHDAPEREIKDVLEVMDDQTLLGANLLQLTRWMADYYMCGWGQVLNAVLPAGAKKKAGTRSVAFVELAPVTEFPDLPKKQQKIIDVLREVNEPIPFKKLSKLAECGPGPIQALIEKKLLLRSDRRVENWNRDQASQPNDGVAAESLTLNAHQQVVWNTLEPALANEGYKPFLLYGITGSGKTELYLRAIEHVVRQGKQALVLVPEISLTPQTIQSFCGRVGEAAVLHSNLSVAERGGHWRKIATGDVQVVVGARSAVFAPTSRLGLIVVDEEHESSFKEEATPRYHARDVAVMRAMMENVPIILGSATPSMESWNNAHRGQYTMLRLPNRVLDRPLPKVSLIDLRHERFPGKRFQALSPTLEQAMSRALRDKGQVMLLLNRRGFSTYLVCPGCGFVESCKFCDLTLTYHRERDLAMCHYCGFEKKPPQHCAECGLSQVRYQGLGTEKLQSEIERKFPGYVVQRMDSDTMRRPGSHKKTLDAFRQGEIDILLGTQMIAKGLDFPNVTVVGVVNADIGLHHSDFRAPERTFQLLAQVAGRTGRGTRGGHVYIQTMHPDHPSIAKAAFHDYEGFVRTEMESRRQFHYPPYQRMARLILRSRNETLVNQTAERLTGSFRTAIETLVAQKPDFAQVRVLGPAEAPVYRLKGAYRIHFQLQSPNPSMLHEVLRRALPPVRLPQKVDLVVDVDPYDMM